MYCSVCLQYRMQGTPNWCSFKDCSQERLCYWAVKFLSPHHLGFRRPTRVSQHKPEEADQMGVYFVQSEMNSIRMNNVNEILFVNKDDPAMYFDTHRCFINEKGGKNLIVRHGCGNEKHCTVFITEAAGKTNLPLLLIFKGAFNGPIASSLQKIVPASTCRCSQSIDWTNNRAMELWKKAVWKPYLQGSNKSILLWDQIESHTHTNLIDSLDTLGTRIIQISDELTSVRQSCDVGITSRLKFDWWNYVRIVR